MEVAALCGSVPGDLTPLTSTVSTRQPLSISASRAVLVSIWCFCSYRAGANERLLSLGIRASGVAAVSPTFTQSRDAAKVEIWEGPTRERGEFYRSISVFTKNEPNQTFPYKKRKYSFVLCFMSYFG